MTLEDHMMIQLHRKKLTEPVPPGLAEYLNEETFATKQGTKFAWFPITAYYPDGTRKVVWWRTIWFFSFRVALDEDPMSLRRKVKVTDWLTNYFVYPVYTEPPKKGVGP